MLESRFTLDATPFAASGDAHFGQHSVTVLASDMAVRERPPTSHRMRLAIVGVVLAHAAVGIAIAASAPVTATFMALFTLESSEVLLLALWLTVGGGALPVRCAGFALGLACLLGRREWHTPAPLSEGWLWWIEHYGLIALFTVIGLWRPRLGVRFRRSAAGSATVSLTASFRQPNLSLVSARFSDPAAPWQFSLRHMFYACTAAAVMLAIYRPLFAAMYHLYHLVDADFRCIDEVLPSIVGLAAIWASLSPGRPLVRCSIAVAFAVFVGELRARLMNPDLRYAMITDIAQTLIIVGSLFVLRAGGYRLVSDPACRQI
jgi:hypothetical protein